MTSSAPLEALLAVQDHDTTLDQLRHRRATLPERSALAEVESRMASGDAAVAEVQARLDVVATRQARLEKDMAAVEARITEVEKRLYSGEVSASRELQAMSAEVDSLRARRSSLEDDVLAAMEEREPLDAEVDSLVAERAELELESARGAAALADAEAAVDAELASVQAEREALAAGVPEDLAATYERLRSKLGGVGAARLVGSSCSGCHLALPATELERVRRSSGSGEVVYCDQCGRILVP
jgi:uncharacterized protein